MSENKIKIALICFDNPFLKPAEGGKKGMLTRIQSLALTEEYDVDVYLHNKRTEGFADNYKGFDKAMTFYQYSMNKTSVGSVLSPYPICVNKRYVSECVAELQKHEYDVAIYEGEQVAEYRYRNAVKAKKHIIYFHDIESEYRKAVAESARNKISELANKSESKKFKGIEAKTNDYFDYMWFVSKEECDKYGSSIGRPEKCRYIPIPSAQVSDKVIMNTESKTLLYVGDLTIVHNFLSMKWFVDEVFVKLKQDVPDAKLHVIGRINDRDKESLNADGVNVLGYVDDLNQEYRDVACVVCPVLYGAGVKVKVIDAMAMGQLVITTGKGVEGTELENGKHLLVSDDSDELLKICLDVLRNSEKYVSVAEKGFDFIKEYHSIENQAQIMRATIKELL